MNAVHQFHFMEVDEETNRHVEQFHVTEQLRLVNGNNFLNGFQLQQKAILDEQVKTQRLLEDDTFVLDLNRTLVYSAKLVQAQLSHQALFVNALDESRAFKPMHFDGGPDNVAAKAIGFFIKRMHGAGFYRGDGGTQREDTFTEGKNG